jgi:hypothetical protein
MLVLSLLLAKLLLAQQLLLRWLLAMLLLPLLELQMLLPWLLLAELLFLLLLLLLDKPLLLSGLLEWQLLLPWLTLLQLLFLLLAELLLLLLGLQMLPVKVLVLLGQLLLAPLLSFSSPRPPSGFFAVLTSKHWLGAMCMCGGLLQEKSMRLSPPRVSKTSLAQVPEASARKCTATCLKVGSGRVARSCTHVIVWLSLLNHRAGGDPHIQLPKHVHPPSSAFMAQLALRQST